MEVKHIAFDIDGTLIDTHELILESILACIPSAERVSAREIALETVGMSPKKILRHFGVHKLDAYWRHHAKNAKRARLFFKDTNEILTNLKNSGISMSIVTSLPAKPAKMLLTNAQISDNFSLIDTYSSRAHKKPSPRVLSLHLSDLGIPPETAVYLGDSVGDIKMAKGAGARALAAGWGPTKSDILIEAGADKVLNNLGELIQLTD